MQDVLEGPAQTSITSTGRICYETSCKLLKQENLARNGYFDVRGVSPGMQRVKISSIHFTGAELCNNEKMWVSTKIDRCIILDTTVLGTDYILVYMCYT